MYHFFRAGDALMVEPRARPASKIFEKSDDTEVFQYPPIKAAQLTTLPQVPDYWCCSAETFGHGASCRKAATEETASNNDTWGKGQSEVHPKSGCQGKIVCQR